ncbi:MAG: hypothetical protein F6J90_06095 [Moorea sp. SIOASIH]|uniref:hypothetical protein n=1 Tax=Moorena sp. SIOASIH TaxID=2607817 RepID=UPI0013B7910D|nr:hypothetical protein [Moorena sp. SIOASIH]NEO35918.1 hypothetical protein [Moorena sp. SIOASIH]
MAEPLNSQETCNQEDALAICIGIVRIFDTIFPTPCSLFPIPCCLCYGITVIILSNYAVKCISPPYTTNSGW